MKIASSSAVLKFVAEYVAPWEDWWNLVCYVCTWVTWVVLRLQQLHLDVGVSPWANQCDRSLVTFGVNPAKKAEPLSDYFLALVRCVWSFAVVLVGNVPYFMVASFVGLKCTHKSVCSCTRMTRDCGRGELQNGWNWESTLVWLKCLIHCTSG